MIDGIKVVGLYKSTTPLLIISTHGQVMNFIVVLDSSIIPFIFRCFTNQKKKKKYLIYSKNILSNHFSSFGPIKTILIQFFAPFWSTSVHSVHFGHSLFLVHFGPLQSLRSTLVHSVHSVHFGHYYYFICMFLLHACVLPNYFPFILEFLSISCLNE